jgi:hemolysin activation/secretion protein
MTTLLVAAALLLPALPGFGQNLPTLDFSGLTGDKRPELLDEKLAAPPALILPVPLLAEKGGAGALGKGVFVKKIVVIGSSVFSAEELAVVTAKYENRVATTDTLESIRRDLTVLYISKGYIVSGAVIPDQQVVDGRITLQIIEGTLTTINLTGNSGFSDTYLRKRIALGAGSPVNIIPLQERLQLLQQDQRIQRVHAELRPAGKPGEAELNVKVDEKPPFSAQLTFNNYQSPSVGAERGVMTLARQNLLGQGDTLSVTYGYSEGVNPLLDTWFALPLNVYDTTLMFRYRKTDSKVIEKAFAPLDIKSKSEAFELSLRQPLYRSLNQEFALSLAVEHIRTDTSLLGEPYSFSPGVDNGRTIVVPIRFSQEWTYRTQQQVVTARSRMSFGFDGWDATVHSKNDGPDGRFFSWLGQLQWAQVTGLWDTQLIARADVQKVYDSVLPVEQIGIGGRYSVRGYRENQVVRDEAFIASLEARVPLVQNERWADYLQICPFFDFGSGSNVDIETTAPRGDLASIGIGMRWATGLIKAPLDLKAEAELYWGHQLNPMSGPNNTLQDNGIHFQLGVTAQF